MNKIKSSLSAKLKKQVSKNKYDLLAEKAEKDEKEGRAVILKTEKDIDDFFNSITK